MALSTVHQVHGREVIGIGVDRRGQGGPLGSTSLGRADAIMTATPGVAVMTLHADCLPIILADPGVPAVAAIHAGWRGTVLDAAPNAVRAMQEAFGTAPADLQAGIGPSIGPERYQVGEEVVDAVRAAFGTPGGLIARAADGSAYLDLWAANRLALERAGVGQIEVAGICTATRTDEFFSHRAERGHTGRFGAVIALAG